MTNPQIFYKETQITKEIEIRFDDLIEKIDFALYNFSNYENILKKKNTTIDDHFSLIISITNKNQEYFEKNILTINFTEKSKYETDFFYSYILPSYNFTGKVLDLGNFWNFKETNFNHYQERFYLTNSTTGITKNNTLSNFKNCNLKIDSNTKIYISLKDEYPISYRYLYTLNLRDNLIDINDINFFINYTTQIIGESNDIYCNKLEYQILEVKNDIGKIMSNFSYSYNIQQNTLSQTTTTSLYFLEISFNKLGKRYDRIYRKIQNIFADLGGLFNSFILLGNILIFQFNKKKFDYDLINFLFKSVDENNKNKLIFPNLKNFEEGNYLKQNKKNINDFIGLSNKEIIVELKNIPNKSHIIHKKNKTSFILNSEINNISQYQMQKSNFSLNNFEKNNSNPNKLNINDDFIKDTNVNFEINDEELKNKIENLLDTKIKRNENRFIKLNNREFYKTFLCCQNMKSDSLKIKEKLIDFTADKVNSYLDVLNYTRFHEDFEKLKMIIFNKSQQISFNFLRPRKYSEITNENYKKDIFDSVKYLKNQENKGILDSYDEKFINLLNDEFKELIYD